jgi:hypothetical protein
MPRCRAPAEHGVALQPAVDPAQRAQLLDRKVPASAMAAYWTGTPWPFDSTKRSRSGQSGRAGS